MALPTGAILVLLDGTSFSEQTLPWSLALARSLQRPLVLLQAIDAGCEHTVYDVGQIVLCLEGLAAGARSQGVDCHATILYGDPHDEIVRFVRESDVYYLSLALRRMRDAFDNSTDPGRLVQELSIPAFVHTPATARFTSLRSRAIAVLAESPGSLSAREAAGLGQALGYEVQLFGGDSAATHFGMAVERSTPTYADLTVRPDDFSLIVAPVTPNATLYEQNETAWTQALLNIIEAPTLLLGPRVQSRLNPSLTNERFALTA